ncbi:MAG: hypothetical protein AABX33_03075 [Nanoarchaeota archaeon]
MTTFEEDLVDVYYNINNYFTMRNIPFGSVNKNKGGKGRGEIDVLAILIKDGKFVNCSHIEVSVSVTSKFPYNDTPDYIIKKFFSGGAEKNITGIIGNVNYFSILITSDFSKNAKDLLRKILSEKEGVEVLSIASTGATNYNTIILEMKYQGKIKKILIQTFTHIFFQLLKKFQEKGYIYKNFQDSRLRSIQHQLHLMKKRDKLKELWEEARGDLK